MLFSKLLRSYPIRFGKIKGSDIIDLTTLNSDEKTDFVDALYSLHSRIFGGVEKEEFIAYVIDSPADLTRIRIYKNKRKECVGYCAAHRFHKRIFNQACVVVRAYK